MKHNVRQTAEDNIRDMAARDPNFRANLLSDPRGALSQVFGGNIPDDVKIKVHEEKPDEIHIVLPAAASAPSGEAQATSYCSGNGGGSWSSCGYELTCYGPTCHSD
jgi:hypothetical protein